MLRRFFPLALGLASLLPAQPVPPAQTHVADLTAGVFRAPADAAFNLGPSYTLEGWFHLTGPVPFGWLMGKGLEASGVDPFIGFALQLNRTGTHLLFASSTGVPGSYRDVEAPAALPLRRWLHLAAVVEQGAVSLYQDGRLVASGRVAGPPAGQTAVPFGVGQAFLPNGSGNYPRPAAFARQVRVWNVARTAAQLQAAAGQALPIERAGLVALWPLDESTGTSARDTAGAGRNLTTSAVAPRRTVIVDTGPFFQSSNTPVTDGALDQVNDSHVLDVDGDGDLDAVFVQIHNPPTIPETRTRLRVFRNDGGTLVHATDAILGNVTMAHPRHGAVADFDGDGRPDLLVVGHGTDTPPFPGEQAKLLLVRPGGRLMDETAARLPARTSFAHNVAVGDIEGDGDVDIYLSNVNGGDTGPRILLNDGRGFFTEATDRIPADIANRTRGLNYTASALVDVDADGFPDLVLGTGGPDENALLLNDGRGRFRAMPGFALPPKILGGRSVTVCIHAADFNGDGAPDLLMGTTGGSERLLDGRVIDGYSVPGLQLLLNRGDGTFHDASAGSGITFGPNDGWVEWVRLADFDGDGRTDLLTNIATLDYTGRLHRIFLSRGGGRFVEATDAFQLPASVGSFGINAADFDRDGRVDILSVTSRQVSLSRGLKLLDRALFLSTPDEPGRLANLSVRTRAGTGDQTLITGFALGGGAEAKPLLVRVVGPTLAAFGVEGVLANPGVEIAPLGAARVVGNDDWGGTAALRTAFASVGAFPLADAASRDAALVFSPRPGAYTATVTGAEAGSGVALVEVYDAGSGNAPRLSNLSARTLVGSGADALFAGFVVNGNVPRRLLVRAVGPTLGAFGVGGVLEDPVLALRPLGADVDVARNDDWRGTAALKAAFASVGAFPLATDTSRDAALVIELPPGAYTAAVSGKAGGTGVALVEIYELP
jgi:hypothetical protein